MRSPSRRASPGCGSSPGSSTLVLRRRRRRAGRPAAALARAARDLGAARRPHADGRRVPRERRRASAVAQTADALVEAVPAERAPPAAQRLPAADRARRRGRGHAAPRADRRARPRRASPDDASAPCSTGFADARLVTLGEGTAEVAHEVLIREWPTLRGWLEEDREGLRLHRRLGDAARIWEAAGRDADGPLPRHPARRGARMGAGAPGCPERDRARVPRRERRRRPSGSAGRSCGPTAACARCSPAPACCSPRRSSRACWPSGERQRARLRPDRRRPAARRSGADRRPARPEPPARPGRPRARRHRGHPQPSPVGACAPSRCGRRDAGRRGPALRAGAEPRRPDARHRRRERGRSCGSTRGRAGGSAARSWSTAPS